MSFSFDVGIAFSAPLDKGSIDEKVGFFVDKMAVSSKLQDESVRELRKLGWEGVPCMIKHLDDNREVPYKIMPMRPGPMADPRMPARSVSAYRVASVLMVILSEITGQWFGLYFHDFEVSSSEELSANKWRRWCVDNCPVVENCAGG